MYRLKGHKVKNSTIIFWKTITEIILLKNPKNPKTIPWKMVCQLKDFDNDDILYIFENVLKNAIQR